MSSGHRIYIGILVVIVLLSLIFLSYSGYTYYRTGMEERFFHPDHESLKPSGVFGHGMGIIGSLFMLVGVTIYIARKRMRSLSRMGLLKHWLEFHIFLCTLGPILVLYHTSFKFGGIVSISFWSMVAVVASGVIGRFIYIQIPRTIEGRELSLNEVRDMKMNISEILSKDFNMDQESTELLVESTRPNPGLYYSNLFVRLYKGWTEDRQTLSNLRTELKKHGIRGEQYRKLLRLLKNEISLNRRIERLVSMQNMFKYWHVAHLPFALVMLVIMIIHVVVTILFGYRWIF
jgi:hypothetical protein